MENLDDIPLNALHNQLEQTTGNKPTQRVLAAIGRKQGATLDTLARRHNVSEKTIRNWLVRFEEQPLNEAPYDDDRPGRPTKLSDHEQNQLFEQLQQSPSEFGYDRDAWFPDLIHQHIKNTFGVTFSSRHIYRLIDKSPSIQTARSRHYQDDLDKKT